MRTTHQPNQPQILVVDDEASNLQLLRHILQDHYRLLFAKDGMLRSNVGLWGDYLREDFHPSQHEAPLSRHVSQ